MSDIVSFETARKLKDAGIDVKAKAWYVTDGDEVVLSCSSCNVSLEEDLNWDGKKELKFYSAPTLEELGSNSVDVVAKKFSGNS